MEKISIIIPCYNCEKTLEDAVFSVYNQNLEAGFEIILINDNSTDDTLYVMSRLSEKFKEIKTFANEKNLGGGATRNKAVEECSNEIIFCLDSDDFLGDGTLKKMLGMIIEKNCDAVGISDSIKFEGLDANKIIKTDTFGNIGERVSVESLFDSTCSLYSVCMFRKKPFIQMGGYPENHGFDTQGFAFRFLLNNFVAYTCPNTKYFHRINFHKSYYLREYESGKVNHNWYHIFEEFFYMFEENVQELILNFDLNNYRENLLNEVKKISPILKNNFLEYKIEENNIYDQYWLGVSYFRKEKYTMAQNIFKEIIPKLEHNLYVHLYLSECVQKTGVESPLIDIRKVTALRKYNKMGSKLNIVTRIFRKLIKS